MTSSEAPSPSRYVLMGAITRPHGVKGNVLIKSFCENPEDLGGFSSFILSDRKTSITLQLKGFQKGLIVAAVQDINSREEAEKWRGVQLYIERNKMPSLDEDEFYYEDLIGRSVYDEEGNNHGAVTNVDAHAAHSYLEIENDAGLSFTLPFTQEAVPLIDTTKIIINKLFLIEQPQRKQQR